MGRHHPHHHVPDPVGEALTALQLQYGVDRSAFVRLDVSNSAWGVEITTRGSAYEFSKGPIHQHMNADDWVQRKYEMETELQKHVHCNPCARVCLFTPFCHCLSMVVTGAACPDDLDDIERITDEMVKSWNVKDAGRIQWTVVTPPTSACNRTCFVNLGLMARDLPATSMMQTGGAGPMAVLGMRQPDSVQPGTAAAAPFAAPAATPAAPAAVPALVSAPSLSDLTAAAALLATVPAANAMKDSELSPNNDRQPPSYNAAVEETNNANLTQAQPPEINKANQ